MQQQGMALWGFISVARRLFIAAVIGSLSFVSIANAEAVPADSTMGFAKALQLGRAYDAQLRSARADNAYYQEEVRKAKASFLPMIRANAAKGRSTTDTSSERYPDPVESSYNTSLYSVSVKQSVLNIGNISAYGQAKAIARQSDALLDKEHSALIAKVAEVYFNVLFATESLEYSRAWIDAAFGQMQQAERRHANGFGTVTEINEAKAGYGLASADKVSIEASLEYNRREMERLTGVYTASLRMLDAKRVIFDGSALPAIAYWLELAAQHNPTLAAARQEVIASGKEVAKNRALRYPVVDLVAARNYSQSEYTNTIGSTYDTYSVALQATMPLYTGGYVSASVRQAVAARLRASEQLSLQERQVVSDIRKYHNGVVSAAAQVKAYELAVHFQQTALAGITKGFASGFRSNIDVLNAQKELMDAQRNLAKARYGYVLNSLLLKDSAGVLAEADVAEVDGWLCKEPLINPASR